MTKIERFMGLPIEKQEVIIDAAMSLFGAMGYKKTSVADIAAASGIAKAMVFYYFGSKKALYLFLMDLAMKTFTASFEEAKTEMPTDFFDRLMFGTKIKLAAMKKYPAMMKFLTSVYLERDKQVEAEIKHLLQAGEQFRSDFALGGVDAEKFKDTVDPKLVLQILVKFSESYVSRVPLGGEIDIDVLLAEFNDCVVMMRNNFYKEEML